MRVNKCMFLTLILLLWITSLEACTIFSGKDKKGQVWAGNNEDFYFTFKSYINVVKTTDSTFGYIYFTHFQPYINIQGGTNEAGLFFDFNAIRPSEYKGFDKKKDFPGGPDEMLRFILKKCKTVQEVLDLFKIYRAPYLETAQMHIADKYGNLGIIVPDSMWITKSPYQISTNYNLCHPDKDGKVCWRFPIADRILKTQGPGLESFREICDSTSQRNKISTIYSNIHNLTTGDIWFYYGLDYKTAFKTNIKDLLKRGNTSFLMHELFLKEPLVSIYKTYQDHGIIKSLKQMESYKLSEKRKEEILKLLTSGLILLNHDFNSYPFLERLIRSTKEQDTITQIINSTSLFCMGNKKEALATLSNSIVKNPNNTTMTYIFNQMQGVFEDGVNVNFELKGFAAAKYVFVDGLSFPNTKYFLIKDGENWIGKFKLLPDEYIYIFIIDGKRVLDPNSHDIVNYNGLDFNHIIVKN